MPTGQPHKQEPDETALNIAGTEEALEYSEQIARQLVLQFPITMDEAVGRINRFWADQDFSSKTKVEVFLYEEPEAWAKTIYCGRDSRGGSARRASSRSRIPGVGSNGRRRFPRRSVRSLIGKIERPAAWSGFARSAARECVSG